MAAGEKAAVEAGKVAGVEGAPPGGPGIARVAFTAVVVVAVGARG